MSISPRHGSNGCLSIALTLLMIAAMAFAAVIVAIAG